MWIFPDRSKTLLSGEEIINFKQNSLKDIPTGVKDYAPDNSWLEQKQIQATLETHHSLVSAQRIEKKSSLSSAEWLTDVGKAKVTKKTGKCWEVFGHTINSEDWLLPEEVLFLLETNALQLYLEEVPLSIEQTYALIIGEFISLAEYKVYSHLSRKGYRVLRHDRDIRVTLYEKEIHADQPGLVAKRSVPGSELGVSQKRDDSDAADGKPEESESSAAIIPVKDADPGSIQKSSLSSAPDRKTPGTSHDQDTNPTSSIPDMLSKSKNLISQVQSLVSRNGDSSEPPNQELFNIDDSSSEDAFPRPASAPDLMLVDVAEDQVIEIDDSPSEEEDEIMVMDVKPKMDTVDLLDSDEDDDVVIIHQKTPDSDPSKWRKWFASEPEFLVAKSTETPDPSTKISKVKMIDLFDLGEKTSETIWKAIPSHDDADEFINSPDQRFIPSTILPKYAQYKVNLQQRNISNPGTPASVDTSRTMNEIVGYGQEPSYFSRSDGYFFHRSRHFNQWGARPQSYNQGRSNFHQNQQGPSFRIGFAGGHQNGDGNRSYRRFGNGNYQNHGNFDNPVQRFPLAQSSFGSNQFSNQFAPQNDGLKMAVVQACQMQMLAMGLLQSCQSIMQQVPGFVNPVGNVNMFPVNSLVGNLGSFNQPQYQNRRPYRRPWRGGQGRKRYFKEDRNVAPPRVTEIPLTAENQNVSSNIIVIDDEDKKVKPAIKRNMALNAIAGLNKPKKPRLKITTEIKSIKLDSSETSLLGPSSSVANVSNVRPANSESPHPEPAGRVETIEGSSSPMSRSISPVDSPARKNTAEESQRDSPLVVSDDGRPSVIDEQISIDSDSVGFVSEKSMDAMVPIADQPIELRSDMENDSRPVEAMDLDVAPGESSVESGLAADGSTGSWKTYKEKEPSPRKEPKDGGPLLAIGNERADIKDVMKSLQVIGPIDAAETPRAELKVSYDVYLPNQPFKKSLRLLPNYRVIIAKSDLFPTIFELNHLESSYPDSVPFLYSVVTSDAVRFYHLRPVSLPSLIPDGLNA